MTTLLTDLGIMCDMMINNICTADVMDRNAIDEIKELTDSMRTNNVAAEDRNQTCTLQIVLFFVSLFCQTHVDCWVSYKKKIKARMD
jgi:hypothetical protein